MASTWVIGDIHGYAKTLRSLLEQLDLAPGDRVITVGDYVNKGPDPKGVIDLLLGLRSDKNVQVDALCGNHEAKLANHFGWTERGFFSHADTTRAVKGCATEENLRRDDHKEDYRTTAASYGWPVEPDDCRGMDLRFPPGHEEFFRSLLPYSIVQEGGEQFLIVHGLLCAEALQQPTMEEAMQVALNLHAGDLLVGRATFETAAAFPGILVHGHTPYQRLRCFVKNMQDFANLPNVVHGKLNVDSGIARHDNPQLTAAVSATRT